MTLLPVFLLLTIHITPEAAGTLYRQPQLAAGYGQVGVTFGFKNTIYYAGSKDGGRSFGTPVKVAEVEALALGRHRGPRVAILADAIAISAVTSGELVVWRSEDQGRNWKRAGRINDVAGATREGLHTMTSDGHGRLFAAWLDLREKGTRLYGAHSEDGGLTWSKNALVYAAPDGTICQCCHPSSVFDEQGHVWTMWRNAVAGARDLYVASSADETHFKDVHRVGTGSWKLEACPMDGGGLVVNKGAVISAWRRKETVFLAQGDQSEKALGPGKDIAVAEGKRGIVAAWTKGEGLQMLPANTDQAMTLSEQGAFVNLVGLPDGGVLAGWETAQGEIQLSRID